MESPVTATAEDREVSVIDSSLYERMTRWPEASPALRPAPWSMWPRTVASAADPSMPGLRPQILVLAMWAGRVAGAAETHPAVTKLCQTPCSAWTLEPENVQLWPLSGDSTTWTLGLPNR